MDLARYMPTIIFIGVMLIIVCLFVVLKFWELRDKIIFRDELLVYLYKLLSRQTIPQETKESIQYLIKELIFTSKNTKK